MIAYGKVIVFAEEHRVSRNFESRRMGYYHFARWPPVEVRYGQTCGTTWRASHYGSRQLDVEQGAKAALASPLGSLFGEDGARLKAQLQRRKETIFEEVRRAEFPDHPSRLDCLFLCEGEEQARLYATTHGFVAPDFGIFEIQPLELRPASDDVAAKDAEAWGIATDDFRSLCVPRRHRANARLLECNMADDDALREVARRYWAGEETAPGALTEVLFRGFFEVVRYVGPVSSLQTGPG